MGVRPAPPTGTTLPRAIGGASMTPKDPYSIPTPRPLHRTYSESQISRRSRQLAHVISKWLVDPRTSKRMGYWDATTTVLGPAIAPQPLSARHSRSTQRFSHAKPRHYRPPTLTTTPPPARLAPSFLWSSLPLSHPTPVPPLPPACSRLHRPCHTVRGSV